MHKVVVTGWSKHCQCLKFPVNPKQYFSNSAVSWASDTAGLLCKQDIIYTKQKCSQDTYQFCKAINTSIILTGIPSEFWLSTMKFWQVFTILFIDLVSYFAILMIFPPENVRKPLSWCQRCQVWKGHQHRNTKMLEPSVPGSFLVLLTAEAG